MSDDSTGNSIECGKMQASFQQNLHFSALVFSGFRTRSRSAATFDLHVPLIPPVGLFQRCFLEDQCLLRHSLIQISQHMSTPPQSQPPVHGVQRWVNLYFAMQFRGSFFESFEDTSHLVSKEDNLARSSFLYRPRIGRREEQFLRKLCALCFWSWW